LFRVWCRTPAVPALSPPCFVSLMTFHSPNVDLNPSKEGSDLIQVQKDRATARWKEAFKKQYFDDQEMYDQVLKQLSHGKVPPIYHTLCRDPEKRLFLPNTVISNGNEDSEKIEISFEKVQGGQGTSQSLTDRSIWKKGIFHMGMHFLTMMERLLSMSGTML
jgi:hypothetical protein